MIGLGSENLISAAGAMIGSDMLGLGPEASLGMLEAMVEPRLQLCSMGTSWRHYRSYRSRDARAAIPLKLW
ncbi:MAG: hypothetical protein CM1200mP22_06060 [Dehalococcoidia bacterium]|nr:MAG: hypothetical protein CM1200mP22_06060 [Dehalococcoidia bacterium]